MAYPYLKRKTWYVGFKDEFGKQVRRATKAKTKTEAQRIGDELERRAERIRLGLEEAPPAPVEWTVVVDRYLQEAVPRLRAREVVTKAIGKHVRPAFAGKHMGAINAGDVSALVTSMLQRYRPGTVEQIRVRISAIFEFARLNRLVRHNPASDVRVDIPESEIRALEPHEVVQLMHEVPRRWRLPVALAVLCGMRRGEVAGVRVETLDFDGRAITIPGDTGQYDGEPTKTKRTRVVPMPEPLVAPLMARAQEVGTGRLFAWIHKGSATGKLVRNAAQRAGINRPFTFKDLRSTWATMALEATSDILFVQKSLGHAKADMTAKRYAHLRQKRALALANQTASHPGLTGLAGLVSLRRKSSMISASSEDALRRVDTTSQSDEHAGAGVLPVSARNSLLAGGTGANSRAWEQSRGDVTHPVLTADLGLSVSDAAYHLNVSQTTIYRLLGAGKLKAEKRGKFLRILTSELERYKREHQT